MVELTIKINPVKIKTEMKLSKAIVIKGNYKKLNESQIEKIRMYILNKPNLTLDDVLSMRSSYMNMKIFENNNKLLKNIKKLKKFYLKGISIKELSKVHDFSPISMLKNIFYKLGVSKNKVKDYFNKVGNISEFDLEQINFALNNDIFNKVDQSEQIENSENFEEKVKNFLLSKNISFKTQDELREEQIIKYGKPINTPDFLILSNLVINGKKINWIDAKNFYGANTFLIRKKIKKQVQKYIDDYGYGCILFSLNFSEKLNFDNVLLLSSMSLI